jgi:serine O-acetyltransferase
VLLQPVPAGATAVGIPARIVARPADAERDAERQSLAVKRGFSAYGLTQGDDPLAQALKGLIDSAGSQEQQIALLWQAIEKLSSRSRELPVADCVPQEARTEAAFDAERLNQLVK